LVRRGQARDATEALIAAIRNDIGAAEEELDRFPDAARDAFLHCA
jgi:hypothetical protein